jgi:hypothetical protein
MRYSGARGKLIHETKNLKTKILFQTPFNCVFQVSPLTALKFAELTLKAGFPPGTKKHYLRSYNCTLYFKINVKNLVNCHFMSFRNLPVIGVVNVLPGTGSVCGQAIADHPLVR